MNHEALLALIADLSAQVRSLQAENATLRQMLQEAVPPPPTDPPTAPPS